MYKNIIDPFDMYSWLTQLSALSIITLATLTALVFYKKSAPHRVRSALDLQYHSLRLWFGWTEPDDADAFTSRGFYSAGGLTKALIVIVNHVWFSVPRLV